MPFCAGIVLVLGAPACARPNGEAPRFSGRYGAGRIESARVGDLRSKPGGFSTLGHVTVRCRADEGVRSLRDEWLGDVDCSEDLLVAALREKAAEVGGQVLVGRECRYDEQRRGDLWKSTLVTCSAEVAASFAPVPVEPGSSQSALPGGGWSAGDGAEKPFESPAQAFRVKVTFNAVDPEGLARKPRPADTVAELAVLPPSDVVLGDVVARCRHDCERGAVRYAVRAAAARVGATDVAGIACVRLHSGFLCTGQAARPEADPETNFLAR